MGVLKAIIGVLGGLGAVAGAMHLIKANEWANSASPEEAEEVTNQWRSRSMELYQKKGILENEMPLKLKLYRERKASEEAKKFKSTHPQNDDPNYRRTDEARWDKD